MKLEIDCIGGSYMNHIFANYKNWYEQRGIA